MKNVVEVKKAQNETDFSLAKELVLEYVEWLAMSGGTEVRAILSSQNFDKEMGTMPLTYSSPDGGIFIALINDRAVGVAGIKRFNESECELKRMYVKDEGRGLGIGKILLTECIKLARELNYQTIKLDTLGFMKPAIKLYTDNGFVEISAYRNNTHKDAKYFELDLKSGSEL